MHGVQVAAVVTFRARAGAAPLKLVAGEWVTRKSGAFRARAGAAPLKH